MPDIPSNHALAIGEKLRTLRQERQMSLRELADKADMSASMLSQIETGKTFPSVRSLYNIAAVLEVSIDYFFPGQNGDAGIAIGPDGNTSVAMTASEMREAELNQTTESDPAGPVARPHPSPLIVHANARPMIELKGGVSWARLTALSEADAEFLEITYDPGAMSGGNMSHHEGREFGLLLEGELVVELGFDSYTLREGDSIIFESSVPHRLINKGSQPMRAVWVVLNRL